MNPNKLSFKSKSKNYLFLKNRLLINKRTQKKDFQSFLLKKINLGKKKIILDLGCGHGQTSKSILKTQKYFKLYSVDVNNKFITNLVSYKKKYKNFFPIKKDMDQINFVNIKFDLIIVSYCFYYSKNYNKLLLKLIQYLNKNGRIIICNPYKPHFMVNFISKIHKINKTIFKSLDVSDYIYKFSKKLKDVSVKKSIFKNQTILNKNDILNSYINSTMYEKKKLHIVVKKIKELKKSSFKFYKNTCLLQIKKK